MKKINRSVSLKAASIGLALFASTALTGALAQESPLANTERAALSFSQLIDPGRELTLGETRPAVASRSYYQRVTGAELARGVDIVTQAPGAIVRLTPIGKSAGVLGVSDLAISANGGAASPVSQSGAIVADQAELRASHPDLFENTLAFKVSDAMGQGRIRLQSKQAPAQDYMIHVFDKNSGAELAAESARQHYFAGEAVSADVRLNNGALKRGAKTEAVLLGPDGQRTPMRVAQNGDGLTVSGTVPEAIKTRPGELWRLAVSYREAGGRAPVYRDTELPLAIGVKAAAIAATAPRAGGVDVTVNVSEAGRYEARTWIFARNPMGETEGAMMAYAAEWLEPGRRTLTLAPDLDKLRAAGYQPPFQIQQLQLLDQSRLLALETRNADALPTIGE